MGFYQPNRLPYLVIAFGTECQTHGFHRLHEKKSIAILGQRDVAKLSVASSDTSQLSYYDIALYHGNEKVTKHRYDQMYSKYLEPYRNEPIKLLEVGLGCDMRYGPGASYYTWLDYFEVVDLYFIEYDTACAEKWAGNTTGATIFTGDQADVAFLNRFRREAGKDFDVIVEDGGHHMKQQIVSLENLWKAVKPGGIYIVEDLQTSYWKAFGGDPANSGKQKTMMSMVKELLDDLNTPTGGHRRQHEVSVDMEFMDCMEGICAFGKRDE